MSFREVKAEELTMNPFTKIGKEWLLIQPEMKKNAIP